MRTTLSNRIITTAAGAVLAAIAAGGQALATPAGTLPVRPPGLTVVQHAAGPAAPTAVRYWTPARMAAAVQAGTVPQARPATEAHPVTQARPVTQAHLVTQAHPFPRVRALVWKPAAVPALRKTPAAGPKLTGNTGGAGRRWPSGGAVPAAVGKVFFTLGGQDYVCSGTLVAGRPADVVLTAAHCVSNGGQPGGTPGWATNWMFIPGFRNGSLPYGEYTARRFFTAPGWTGPQGGTEQYDVAFVQVTVATLDGEAKTATPPPGLPVTFARSQDAAAASRASVLGYPAEPPYSGLYLNYCAGPAAASRGSLRTSCAMTAGDSGGPWLTGVTSGGKSAAVVAVSTYKLSGDPRVLYGAVLGPRARTLYQRAVSTAG